ncbi:uncharacterized protein GGS22DRAFT_195158 [Annulohypoxylon maeteangense]|uniref:uncharacterized protein n=1 Tax=Annulohypoxylon maeteangense TaxID=1927788 RepID=UPI002008AF1D|nr:uncharacterized protein GGS22DRAFT_195158 [Annulohypoxylon maeteangense]KAI0883401.1 hypothetical protein GGS22DRAFT_195158 [Annulohypoxylon maeteangense]
MEHDHVINIDLEKPEYSQPSQTTTPSVSPPESDDGRAQRPIYAASNKSCFVCRKTLLLSYFNCCAACLGIAEYQLSRKRGRQSRDILPTSETSTSSSSSSPSSSTYSLPQTPTNTPRPAPHCDSPSCRYTHQRVLMLLFIVFELIPSLGGLAILNIALYRHDFSLLRFAGMLLLQWWQIFVLPRQWACGRSIVAGQLAACVFMVWFYVDAARVWRW